MEGVLFSKSLKSLITSMKRPKNDQKSTFCISVNPESTIIFLLFST